MHTLFVGEEARVTHTEHSGFLRIPSLCHVKGERGDGIVMVWNGHHGHGPLEDEETSLAVK